MLQAIGNASIEAAISAFEEINQPSQKSNFFKENLISRGSGGLIFFILPLYSISYDIVKNLANNLVAYLPILINVYPDENRKIHH